MLKTYNVFKHGASATTLEVYTVKKIREGKYSVVCTYVSTNRDRVRTGSYIEKSFECEFHAISYLNYMHEEAMEFKEDNETITAY